MQKLNEAIVAIKLDPYSKKLGIDSSVVGWNNQPPPHHEIQKFSDIIKKLRIDEEDSPLRLILENATQRTDETTPWVGCADGGFARPFRSGIWYRGQANNKLKLTPTIFRIKHPDGRNIYVDEKNCFNELRLRIGDENYFVNGYFDTLCKLRHHSLPCRLLDWSESPSVALYFALSNAKKHKTDAVFSALNVFRLNEISSIFAPDISPGIAYPHHLDVLIRSAMSSHMYIEDVFVQAGKQFSNHGDSKTLRILEILRNPEENKKEFLKVCKKSLMPIAVYPNRTTNRMIAQSSTFTLHGGKIIYGRDFVEGEDISATPRTFHGDPAHFIDRPIDVDEINNNEFSRKNGKPFVVHFLIKHEYVSELLEEFEMLGMDESRLFVNIDSHISTVANRWTEEVADS